SSVSSRWRSSPRQKTNPFRRTERGDAAPPQGPSPAGAKEVLRKVYLKYNFTHESSPRPQILPDPSFVLLRKLRSLADGRAGRGKGGKSRRENGGGGRDRRRGAQGGPQAEQPARHGGRGPGAGALAARRTSR